MIAATLARWGISSLALIDPDHVEPHNADAGEFHSQFDEGRNKAIVVASTVRRLLHPGGQVTAHDQSVLAALPFSAARRADVIISCVDDDGARLIASLIASSHSRIHLDIGTQVTKGNAGRRTAGADIRLIIPGRTPRCLACFGGFAQQHDLARLAGFETLPTPGWQQTRSGSLRTVNQIAAHLGLRLIERMASGEICHSTWLRYEDAPLPTLREINPEDMAVCPICTGHAASGDAVLVNRDTKIRQIVRAITNPRSGS